MFRIYRVDTKTFYEDVFETYEDAVQMAKWFIEDDLEYNEPVYTYAIVTKNKQAVAFLRKNDYFEISSL